MSTIVVGYVMKPEGDAALDWAISQAKRDGSRLVLIHSSRGGDHETAEEVLAYRTRGDEIEQRLTDEGLTDVRLVGYVLGNKPVEDVLKVAAEEEATMLVIGIRQRSSVGKFILGSNAQDIIMDSPCPVVTVRAT